MFLGVKGRNKVIKITSQVTVWPVQEHKPFIAAESHHSRQLREGEQSMEWVTAGAKAGRENIRPDNGRMSVRQDHLTQLTLATVFCDGCFCQGFRRLWLRRCYSLLLQLSQQPGPEVGQRGQGDQLLQARELRLRGQQRSANATGGRARDQMESSE